LIKIDGEGMPIFTSRKANDDRVKKGTLYVKFEIMFPKTLREEQRIRIERILSNNDQ
jgi:DnaJ-class molecular chaperone